MWYIHKTVHIAPYNCSAMKRNEVLVFTMTQIYLSEHHARWKICYGNIHMTCLAFLNPETGTRLGEGVGEERSIW